MLLELRKRLGSSISEWKANAASITGWALYPVVKALQALRGFEWENTTTAVAESVLSVCACNPTAKPTSTPGTCI